MSEDDALYFEPFDLNCRTGLFDTYRDCIARRRFDNASRVSGQL